MGSVSGIVCVTGASGFIGSWLVMRLLERGYAVRATVRDPANMKKVKHLLQLPKADTHLTLWKADLALEGSFDDAINGCAAVFHVATPMDFESKDPEMYFVSKTLAEQEAWKFAEQHNMDFITVIPPLVVGPFLMDSMPPSLITALSPITGNEAHYSIIKQGQFVHLDDLCMGHIFLLEHPEAEGRYICSSHDATIHDIARMLDQKYPECNVPIKFENIPDDLEIVHFSSKKIKDLGFQFKYSLEDMFTGAVDACREKGLLPKSTETRVNGTTDQK
ncbi:bifunctional dihydroflavonol 4-reductase/flavanone 4-reductase-like isoform X2 [Prosopis cineraria]|uniref:bifunctional dihydroflavonol 4-reductase/flavanone 4-reductase-like isoform X2 n=1 Tax=Prosopis cineraria TaxID=364024 RepID=UPI00240F879F|nr:bifunctional dihydroflavonol 4-reductase/flavanone 4-reductase-like isoform X2 [Prosopis cineraria]